MSKGKSSLVWLSEFLEENKGHLHAGLHAELTMIYNQQVQEQFELMKTKGVLRVAMEHLP